VLLTLSFKVSKVQGSIQSAFKTFKSFVRR
jgi:hypothetical protein